MAVYSFANGLMKDPAFGNYFYVTQGSVGFAVSKPKPIILRDTYGSFDVQHQDPTTIEYGIGSFPCRCNVPGWWITDGSGDETGLINSALANLAGGTINALVALLELPETLKMLADLALAILRAARHFRKGNWMEGIKSLAQETKMSRRDRAKVKEASQPKNRKPEDAYLGYNFGIVPAINDAQGALEAVKRKIEKGDRLSRSRSNDGKSGAQRKLDRNFGGYGEGAPNRASVNPNSGSATVTVHGTVANADTVNLAALGFTNPIGAAWEVIPYSFVVDYFFDVSGWLGALAGTAGIQDIDGCIVRQVIRRKYCQIDFKESVSHQIVARIPLSMGGFGFPKLPGLSAAGVGSKQVANMGALLAQGLRVR
jgi:hypothetical protein